MDGSMGDIASIGSVASNVENVKNIDGQTDDGRPKRDTNLQHRQKAKGMLCPTRWLKGYSN